MIARKQAIAYRARIGEFVHLNCWPAYEQQTGSYDAQSRFVRVCAIEAIYYEPSKELNHKRCAVCRQPIVSRSN